MKRTILILVCLFVAFTGFAQAIDNTSSMRRMDSDTYFRINYENDFFTATDYYYTQGVSFEYANPTLKKFLLSRLLIHPESWHTTNGIAYELDGYTPTNIREDFIRYGDRPFAGCMMLKTFNVAVDSTGHNRIASNFTIGVIGQAGGGRDIQYNIHKWLHNILPHGWQYQIRNDAIINYGISHEKQLLAVGKWISLKSWENIQAGTLNDKIGVGTILSIGNSSNSFTRNTGFFKLRVYEQPIVSAIAYDATLQGGMLDHGSPYAIPTSQINRITFQNNLGFVINIGRLNLEYFQTYLSKEFKTGQEHKWGGVRIGVVF